MQQINTKHETLHEALWWEAVSRNRIKCNLCPRACNIPNGSWGFCTVRCNKNGRLYNSAFGRSTGFAVDPIEKKPLYHFFPGSQILSFGTVGCNLGCKFCQNWHISKVREDKYVSRVYNPKDIVQLAIRAGSIGIAYTYNDPIIIGEWVMDIALEARQAGLKNVMVTNGYITSQARPDVFHKIDAVNVDLKAFSENFYKKLTLSHLEPVLDTLRWLVHETKIWVEITTLIIPGENDSEGELDNLTRFIAQELNPDIPLHFSAFHPDFKLLNHPPTPLRTMQIARSLAQKNGLKYVYLGNVMTTDGQNTFCPGCTKSVIDRRSYYVQPPKLNEDRCTFCGYVIPGLFGKEK